MEKELSSFVESIEESKLWNYKYKLNLNMAPINIPAKNSGQLSQDV